MVLSFNKTTKVITVLSPDTEITVQNLLNGIREYEDELDSMDIPVIVSCAGKEPLGGGVIVGLTLSLLDGWKLAFEARSGPNYIQCSVSGGNLVSSDGSSPIKPTAFTQIMITASSSATLQELSAIQYASFGGGVTVDIVNGVSGTDYNIGTIENPVNNLTDAVAIANERGFHTLFISESMTLDSGTNLEHFNIVGRSTSDTYITIDPSALCEHIGVRSCNVSGTLDGHVRVRNSLIGSVNYVNGHVLDSFLYGTIILSGSEDAVFANCGIADPNNIPTLDMGGSGQDAIITDYSGDIKIKNMTGANKIEVQMDGGRVYLESTITAGSIEINGIGEVFDSSTGSAVVSTSGLFSNAIVAETVWSDSRALTKGRFLALK